MTADGCTADAVELAECHACGLALASPAAVIPIAGDFVPVCSIACIEAAIVAEQERTTCPLCSKRTPEEDRLPLPGSEDKPVRYAHFACVAEASASMGHLKTATLLRRSGPAFRGRL